MRRALLWATELFVLMTPAIFGLYSLIAPSPSLATLPEHAQWGTYALCVAASLLLAAGRYGKMFPAYVAGHVLAIMNLLTIGFVTYFASFSPVAINTFAFAAILALSLRKAISERRLLISLARGK